MINQLLSPRLVLPGEAAVYDQLEGERVHILLSGQDTGGAFALFIDEVPSHAGPPLHLHHHEDETFYVLEGELVVQVGEERFVLPAGCAAFLPRGVPHAFTNLSSETARALVVLTPGGLERFFAVVEPLVTQAEPDMTAVLTVAARYKIEVVGPPLAGQLNGIPVDETSARVVHPETATTYKDPGGETIHVLLAGEQTNGQLALLQGEFPSGSGVSLHRHRREDEAFYVLEGALTTQVGTEMATAVAGAAAFLPKNVPHDFHNANEQTAKALALIVPAGFENYFAETYALLAQGNLDEEKASALAQKYDLESIQ